MFLMRGYHALIDQDSVARFEETGRGKGIGKDYLPWLRVQDVSSRGRSSKDEGWKTGRIHHFLSELELSFYYVGEWSSVVTDMREQYPLLPLDETLVIAQECGIPHPKHPKTEKPIVMTTDFLLTVSLEGGGSVTHARALKYAADLGSQRTLKKLEIERRYWEARQIDWGIVTERDIPADLAQNVEILHESWYLDTYMPKHELAQIVSVLTCLEQQNPQPLRELTASCDAQLGFPRGTSLKVAYYLIATRQWIIDMFQPLDPSHPLELLKFSLHSLT
jgi:TnsA endonuclease N terminal/TnsA endonuclease C terminal